MDEETKISYKFNRFLEEYDLDFMFEIEEYETAIAEIKGAVDRFEDIHIRLKRDMGEKDYSDKYPKFSDRLKLVTEWISTAKRNLRQQKRDIERERKNAEDAEYKKELSMLELEGKQKELERSLQVNRDKERLRNQVKYLGRRINSDIKSIENEGSHFMDDINRNIETVRQLMKDFTELLAEVETVFGPDFEGEFGVYYTGENQRLSDALNFLMTACRESRQKEIQIKGEAERFKALEIEKMKTRENAEKIVIFDGVYANIKEKIEKFEEKCSIDFTEIEESKIIQLNKEIKSLDSDFKDIVDWITKLVKATPRNYPQADEVLETVNGEKERMKVLLASYEKTLAVEVKERDLIEGKIKNVATLGLKLGKFGGYSSDKDYYTFKSDFEKLIVPRIQAKLLPDYLKCNHLEGQALQIVKEIDSLDDIWERLKVSFGNVNMLLSNKLKSVEDSEPLARVRGDEKNGKGFVKA